jgi:lipoyl-dependent peroxiredoxin
MKPFTRKASVSWRGTRARGTGAMSTTSATLFKVPYDLGHRLGGKGTNPPELIAAAHAGSFSIALANELGDAGYSPDQIDTVATVTMENNSPGWTMTQIHLDVIATVAGAPQCDFIDATLRAKASCPISRLLNANISMRAEMKSVGGRGQER